MYSSHYRVNVLAGQLEVSSSFQFGFVSRVTSLCAVSSSTSGHSILSSNKVYALIRPGLVSRRPSVVCLKAGCVSDSTFLADSTSHSHTHTHTHTNTHTHTHTNTHTHTHTNTHTHHTHTHTHTQVTFASTCYFKEHHFKTGIEPSPKMCRKSIPQSVDSVLDLRNRSLL